jgi:hypothetical protein
MTLQNAEFSGSAYKSESGLQPFRGRLWQKASLAATTRPSVKRMPSVAFSTRGGSDPHSPPAPRWPDGQRAAAMIGQGLKAGAGS